MGYIQEEVPGPAGYRRPVLISAVVTEGYNRHRAHRDTPGLPGRAARRRVTHPGDRGGRLAVGAIQPGAPGGTDPDHSCGTCGRINPDQLRASHARRALVVGWLGLAARAAP